MRGYETGCASVVGMVVNAVTNQLIILYSLVLPVLHQPLDKLFVSAVGLCLLRAT